MNTPFQFKIHPKERFYFMLMSILGISAYAGLICAVIFMRSPIVYVYCAYALAFIAFSALMHTYLIGFLRGNAIKVSEQQFPEVFEIFKNECEKLGLAKLPTLWLLQGGGLLNAFATRFKGHNHVVLYSDVLAAAYDEGIPAVKFILGHELGHIKRNHVSFGKSLLILPARLVPFLGWAYSRSCEYTCDSIGYTLAPEGAEKGILILAAGRELYKKVDVREMIASAHKEKGFALWFAGICSTHPHIVKRIEQFERLKKEHEHGDSLTFNTSKRAPAESYHQQPKNDTSDQPPAAL